MIVIDTDLLIDVLRKEHTALAFVTRSLEAGEELATTSVNVAEVLRGANESQKTLAVALRILDGLVEVPFGPRAARRFGALTHGLDRAGQTMPVADALVAAATLEAGGRLATRNARHFTRVPGLVIVDPDQEGA